MLPGVMRLALLTQVMNYRGKWNFSVALLPKVIADINCVIFLVDTSPNVQITGKKEVCFFSSICVVCFQYFIMGLLAPSHANDIG